MLPELAPAYPEIFTAVAAMAVLMVGVFQKDRNSIGQTGLLSVVVLIVAGMIVLGMETSRVETFSGLFVFDAFAFMGKLLVLIGAVLTLILGLVWLDQERVGRFEYPVLVLFSVVGMMMMISANDLMSLYMGLELQSLCLYLIASYQRDDARSTEAGLKYFVLGAVASGMYLYGASLVYGLSGGHTGFPEIAAALTAEGGDPPLGMIVGLVFIVAALAFKISAVPFHMWTPDVYQGAPTPVTAFFSVAPKIAAMVLMVRVLSGPFGPMADQWQQVVVFIAIASMVFGSLAAIAQTDIKRLMAYSSIGHVGFALVGLAAGTDAGARAVLVYFGIYLVMNIGTFAVILAMRRGGAAVEEVSDVAGIGRTNPGMALALLIMMFSMAGIPPLAGFFAKYFVFMAAIEAGLVALAVIGVLASVVSAFYYLRIVKLMYFDEAETAFDPMRISQRLILAATSLAVLLFFLAPGPLLSGAETAAAALFETSDIRQAAH